MNCLTTQLTHRESEYLSWSCKALNLELAILLSASVTLVLRVLYGTVSAKIAPRLKCYKNASRLNRYNFLTDIAIDFPFSILHSEMVYYEVLKIGSR